MNRTTARFQSLPLLSLRARAAVAIAAVTLVASATAFAGHESRGSVAATMSELSVTRITLPAVTIVARNDR